MTMVHAVAAWVIFPSVNVPTFSLTGARFRQRLIGAGQRDGGELGSGEDSGSVLTDDAAAEFDNLRVINVNDGEQDLRLEICGNVDP